MASAVILLAGTVLDGGLTMAARIRALDVAQAAARAGANELDLLALRSGGVVQLDPTRADAAAMAFLADAGATGTVTASPSSVTVTVTGTQPTQLLRLVGIPAIPFAATATSVPVTGPAP